MTGPREEAWSIKEIEAALAATRLMAEGDEGLLPDATIGVLLDVAAHRMAQIGAIDDDDLGTSSDLIGDACEDLDQAEYEDAPDARRHRLCRAAACIVAAIEQHDAELKRDASEGEAAS